ncbi:MAG TPA: hypothetical protein DEO57_02140 [Phycisphaerales bacterium]|nr:hypothetical protein [Phycisphaerales bacterium]
MIKSPSAIAIVQCPASGLEDSTERVLRASSDVLLTVRSVDEIESHLAALRGAPCMIFVDGSAGVDYGRLRGVRETGPHHALVAMVQDPGVDAVVDALRFGFVDVLELRAGASRWRLAADRAAAGLARADRHEGIQDGMPLREALLVPERRIILAALDANDWNRRDTARQLQIDRTTLYKKMKQFRIAA